MTIRPLTEAGIDEVVARLGFDARPTADLDGLRAVYGAWCLRVPFDNLRKLVALHHSMRELPGIDPADFFAAWLLTGAGGTCWPSNNALHALLTGLGFDARLHGASMFDAELNHGTTVVMIGGAEWLVDTSFLNVDPVPLVPGETAVVDYQGYVVTARPDAGGWLFDSPSPDPGRVVPCRLHRLMDHDETQAAYERSRVRSPFNAGIMCHTNDAGGVWMLRNGSLTRFDAEGATKRAVSDDEVDRFLIDHGGHSPQLVAEVRAVEAEAGDPES